MTPEQWVAFINNLGFPVAVTAVLLYGLWRGCSFVAQEILLPVAAKLMALIEHLQVCQTRQVEATETMCGQVADLATTQQQHGQILGEIRGKLNTPQTLA